MKFNKIKYFGVCATTLLTVAPVAANSLSIVANPATAAVVRAATTIDADYQNSLNNGFKSAVNLTREEISKISSSQIKGTFKDGSFNYANVGSSAALFKEDAKPAANDDLRSNLQDEFLKNFVQDNASVGFLTGKSNYQTKMEVTGTRLSTPTSAANLITQLNTLNVGDTFAIKLTTTNADSNVVATKTIDVTVSQEAAKIGLATVPSVNAKDGDVQRSQENVTDLANAIKNVRGEKVFQSSDLNGVVSKGAQFYYATTGSQTFVASSDQSKFTLPSGETGMVVTQLVPVPYTAAIARVYDANSFVFLDDEHKVITSSAQFPAPSADAIAYVKRQIIVGNVNNSNSPVFKYNFSGSSIPTYKNGDTVTLNTNDQAKLTYKYDDQTSYNSFKSYLEGEFKSALVAYGSVDQNDKPVGDALSVSYRLPDSKTTAASEVVVVTATNLKTGIQSSVKVPVAVTGIPAVLEAPTVTAFPKDTVSVNSKTTKSYDPLKDVKATYVGRDGKTTDLPKANIKIKVTDSANKEVALNSDGSIPTTTTGTFQVTYVFANPDDSSKTVTKTLNLKVAETSLNAPTVNNFVGGTYTLSNAKTKSLNPFAAVLKMDQVSASYVGADQNSHNLTNDQVKVKVTDAANKEVALNSDGTISLAQTGTYQITYNYANPEDQSQVTTKTLTLKVNDTVTAVPVVQDATAKDGVLPEITADKGTHYDPRADLEFVYYYDSDQKKGIVPNDNVSYQVTKDDKKVELNQDGSFEATEAGTYTIKFMAINPLDNALTTSYTRTLTVKPKEETKVVEENGVVYVNYVWGYGVNLWLDHNTNAGAEKLADGSFRKLATGSAWKYSAVATDVNGNVWYKLGNRQWIQGEYASKTPIVNPNSWNITNKTGVGHIKYVPGYGVNLWTSPDQKAWTKKLNHGTAWKYFKIATKGGKTMYNLGGNQWVDGQYFK